MSSFKCGSSFSSNCDLGKTFLPIKQRGPSKFLNGPKPVMVFSTHATKILNENLVNQFIISVPISFMRS